VQQPGHHPPWTFDALLRELVDEKTYPRLHRIAWSPESDSQPSEREEFLFGLDRILDGVQTFIDVSARGTQDR
jgi:Tetracyclin repressor-like, C-terminal domain